MNYSQETFSYCKTDDVISTEQPVTHVFMCINTNTRVTERVCIYQHKHVRHWLQ